MTSPSESIIKAQSVVVQDSRGRKIEIKKPKILDRMLLTELVGGENASNEQYLGFAMLAYSVQSIDGNPVGRPGNKLALQSIVAELDDDGFDAVSKGFTENFIGNVADGETAKETVKNA